MIKNKAEFEFFKSSKYSADLFLIKIFNLQIKWLFTNVCNTVMLNFSKSHCLSFYSVSVMCNFVSVITSNLKIHASEKG